MAQRIKVSVYLLLWFGLIAVCSLYAPYFSNDYRYMLIQGTHNDLVTSFYDVLVSQYRHYFEWGGRTVDHVIAQTLLWWGKPWQSIIQAGVYVLMILTTVWLGLGVKPTLKLRLWPVVFTTLMFWLCIRNFGEVVINTVSSCNYLYSTLLIMLFMLPFRLSFKEDKCRSTWWMALLMFPFGILAGWTNENSGFAAVCVIGIYNLYLIRARKITAWQVTGGIGLLIGYIILMLAPGNEARMVSMEDKGFSFVSHFFNSSIEIFGISLLTQHVLLIALVLVLYTIKRHALKFTDIWQYRAGWWLSITAALSLGIMLASSNFPARSAAPFTFFLTSGVLAFWQLCAERGITVLPRVVRTGGTVLAFLFVAVTGFNAVQGYKQAYYDNQLRGLEIMHQLSQGKKDLVVSPFNVNKTKYLFISDVHSSPTFWSNLIVQRFYGINSIRRLCDEPDDNREIDFVFISRLGKPICTLPGKQAAAAAAGSK